MTDKPFKQWHSFSDKALSMQIGAFIRYHRLEKNKTQDALAYEAGISRSTLSLLERGETVTLATLIRALRVLDQLQVMDAFGITETISPLMLAKAEKAKRLRAKNSRSNVSEKSDW